MKKLTILITLLIFSSLTFAQSVEIKDADGQLLMQVNDEGENISSVTIPSCGTSAPTSTLNKLYNIDGELQWNSGPLAMGDGSFWTLNSGNVYRSSGNVGIGTTTPTANLHVGGDDGFLVQGTYNSGTTLNLGAGIRMHFYPNRGAFRAGYVNGTQWDDANIGIFSTAMGESTTASGTASTAMGSYTTASGNYSTVMGSSTIASGDYSTAMGVGTIASGFSSTAMGREIEASGDYSVAIALEDRNGENVTQSNTMTIMGGNVGIGTTTPTANLHVSGDDGFLVQGGTYNSGTTQNLGAGTRMHFYPKKGAFRAGRVSGTQWDDVNIGGYSTAIGEGTTASGYFSTAMGGYTTASGDYSTAMGRGITASGDYSVAIALNDQNGANVAQFNTMAIMGGNVGIGVIDPSYLLEVGTAYCAGGAWVDGSSRKYKENIVLLALQEAMETLTLLEPVKFNYKTDLTENCVGFIAEDVPELVAINGRNGLSPMDIVAVLTKVTQEQQNLLEDIQQIVEAQQVEINELKNR